MRDTMYRWRGEALRWGETPLAGGNKSRRGRLSSGAISQRYGKSNYRNPVLGTPQSWR